MTSPLGRLRAKDQHLLGDVGNVPNTTGTVVCNEHAAVFGDGHAYRTTPYLAVLRDAEDEKIFITTIGMAFVHEDTDDFVARAVLSVPGAVLGSERVAVIFPGELAG